MRGVSGRQRRRTVIASGAAAVASSAAAVAGGAAAVAGGAAVVAAGRHRAADRTLALRACALTTLRCH